MIKFTQKEKDFYEKIKLLASVPDAKVSEKSLTSDDMFQICKYTSWSAINPSIAQKLSQFRTENNNSCLHVAAQFDNKNLVKGLVENKVIDPNVINDEHQNPLMHMLHESTGQKLQKIGFFLARYTNLKMKNKKGKMAYEMQLSQMNPTRARLLDELKKKSQQ